MFPLVPAEILSTKAIEIAERAVSDEWLVHRVRSFGMKRRTHF